MTLKNPTSFTMMFAFPFVQLTNYFHNIAQLDTFFSVFLAFTLFPPLDFYGKILHLLPFEDVWLAFFEDFIYTWAQISNVNW